MSWNPLRFLESATPAVATAPKPGTTKSTSTLPQTEGYELLEVIGQGGMATVYRGRNRRTGEAVAVKILRRELASKPELCSASSRNSRLPAPATSAHLAEPRLRPL
jgi:serine/threonine-protein kinase